MAKLSIWKYMSSYVPRKNSSFNKNFKKNIFRIYFETYINPKIAKNIIWSIMKINIQLSKWCVRDEILIMSIVLLYPRVIFAICLTVCLIKEHWFNKLYLGFISGPVLERFFRTHPLPLYRMHLRKHLHKTDGRSGQSGWAAADVSSGANRFG